jgi:leader peptidase (prepilin peptidase) / N-methyltransferase
MEFISSLPMWLLTTYFFMFGLAVGSFCNVCIYRLPREESIVFPSSHCVSCQNPIAWRDNVPILGYLTLLGKCRNCSSRISIIYPMVELITGILVAGVYLNFGLSWETIIFSIVVPTLVVITIIDWEHQIIPDVITLPGILFGFAAGSHMNGFLPSLIGFLIGGGLFYLIAIFSGGKGMGGGDIKYMAAVGALLAWKNTLLIIFSASLLGTIYGLPLILLGEKGRKSKVPFGPFLAGATLIAIFSGDQIIWLYLNSVT